MGVGDSEQPPAADASLRQGDPAGTATGATASENELLRGGGKQGPPRDERSNEQGGGRGGRGCQSEKAASPSPRRVLFGSVREALVAGESYGRAPHSFNETSQHHLDHDDLGGGYVVLRRQRSLSVGVESTIKPPGDATTPAPDAAGYTVIRRRAASDASASASARGNSRTRPSAPRASARQGMTGSDAKRRHPRRNQRAGAAARGGDTKDRRSTSQQLQHEKRSPAAGPPGSDRWGATSPLGSMTSLRRALSDVAGSPLPVPPGLEGSSQWLPQDADTASGLWPPVPLAATSDLGQQLQLQEAKGDEGGGPAWAAAASAGVLASRSVPAWPPPPSSAVETLPIQLEGEQQHGEQQSEQRGEQEDKVAGWLGWVAPDPGEV